jgi:hypothetical protein
MNLEPLNQAIEAAYQTALTNPHRVPPQEIAPNVMLQTDIYVSPFGSGFRVVCKIFNPEDKTLTLRVKNQGPDTESEKTWTTYKMIYSP